MTTRRYRDLSEMVEEFTSDYSIDKTNGGHLAVTLRRRGRSRKVFCSLTPSDVRERKNNRMILRRVWRELVEETKNV